MKSQKLVMHKAVWVSKPLTRQVHLVPPQSSNISKKSWMHVFLAGISLKNNPYTRIATLQPDCQ